MWRLSFHLQQGDTSAAEDLVQVTFLKAFQRLGSFRGQGSLRSWLLAICRNTWRDQFDRRSADRRSRVVALESLTSPSSRDADRDQLVAADSEAATVAALDLGAALAKLPEDEREAFVLIDVMQKTAQEAADMVGAPRTTVFARLTRARQKLAALLESYGR